MWKSCSQDVNTELRIGQLGNLSFTLVLPTRLPHSTCGLMSDGAAPPMLLGDPLEPREKNSLGRRDNWNIHTPLFLSFAIHCLKWKRKLIWWVREGGGGNERMAQGEVYIGAVNRTHNRPFRSSPQSPFQSEAKCEVLLWKSVFIHIEIGTNYHNKSFCT